MKSATQKNDKIMSAATPPASTAPAKHQFIGTNPTKMTSGPSVMKNKLVGPEGSPYMVASAYTNGGKN